VSAFLPSAICKNGGQWVRRIKEEELLETEEKKNESQQNSIQKWR
jgi:hypothetical protein